MMRRRFDASDDEGTVLLLTLGFTVLALLLILVVSAATHVHLQRMRLVHVADELALDAADALDIAAYYRGEVDLPEGEAVVPLAQGTVLATAQSRVADAAARANLPATEVVSATTEDGFSATVTVTTTVYPLFGLEALLPFADGVTLTATSSARAY